MTDTLVRIESIGPVEVPFPEYQTTGAAGVDLRAALQASVMIAPGERVLIPTGLRMAIPAGFEGQVRPRSGLAAKHGITVLNSPGTVDSDYRGEVKVLLINLGQAPVTIVPLDRIAQIVFSQVTIAKLQWAASLDETARGTGGYGSTGSA
jgi:dUTP pyrophosphatase